MTVNDLLEVIAKCDIEVCNLDNDNHFYYRPFQYLVFSELFGNYKIVYMETGKILKIEIERC